MCMNGSVPGVSTLRHMEHHKIHNGREVGMLGSAAEGQKQPRMEGHEARERRSHAARGSVRVHRHFIDVWVGGSVVRLGGLPVKYSDVALFCGKY